jgi:hypothetical protein
LKPRLCLSLSLPGHKPWLGPCLPGLSPGLALPGQTCSMQGQSRCPGRAMPGQSQGAGEAFSAGIAEARTPYPGSPGGSPPYPSSGVLRGGLASWRSIGKRTMAPETNISEITLSAAPTAALRIGR